MNQLRNTPFWVKLLIYLSSDGKHLKQVQWVGAIFQILLFFILVGIDSDYWIIAIVIDAIITLWFNAAQKWIKANTIA
jgi:hypothetical protein